jgi:drug/metabolite transporter (DMT)-like permease
VKLIRLRAGEWLAGIAAIAIVVALALPWYGARAREATVTGFESFTVIGILLVLAAAVGIALVVLQATRDSPTLPVAFGVLTVTVGVLATLLVLYRLINEPGPDEFLDVRAGAWLGLAATALMTAGGWLSLAAEGVRGLPPGPEPELRPTPRIAHRAQP